MLSTSLRALFLAVAICGAALLPGTAARAATGGVTAPSSSHSPAPTGGVRPSATPTLSLLSASSKVLYAYGSPLRVTFQIDGRMKSLPASLRVRSGGAVVKSIQLGTVTTGSPHTYALAPDAALPAGRLELRIRANGLRRGPHASAATQIAFATHRFPLTGTFTYGDGFGVDRPGHRHQGQDLLAKQGTPVVAPRGGTVTKVAYQAGGAGNYVVVSGAGESLDYVFMHLADGTTRVREGQVVRSGQRIGDVGSTGASSAPHLHFEIWQGRWAAGGKAIDPLPYLKSWR